MNRLLFAATLVTSLSATSVSAKTQGVDSVKIDNHLYLLRLNSNMGNTTSVVFTGKEGTLLVDPNFDGSDVFIRQHLNRWGADKVDFVTSTHAHRDHTEQYPAFLSHAIGIIPEAQRAELAGAEFMQQQLPQLSFSGKTTLHLNGETIELATLPTQSGHTNGDLTVYFKNAGVLYVGDYLFIDGYPIIDRHSGDLNGYLSNIEYILSHYPATTKVLAGHTTFGDKPFGAIDMSTYTAYYQDLKDSIEYIRGQLGKGQSIDELIKAGLPKRFAKYNPKLTFVKEKRWIRFVADYYQLGK